MIGQFFSRRFASASRGVLPLLGCLAFALCCQSCGKAPDPWEKTHPVKGKVTFKGKPLAGANLSFIPLESYPDSVRPLAYSDEAGNFELQTYGVKDGAPVGKYKVVAIHYPHTVVNGQPKVGGNDLPRKYSSKDTTDLEITVQEGENDLPALELK
ncbi:hypothetical protein SH668x_001142 [Planctomicrobium sp. SH668]|uniref:hypothetical protein n=1 Tax=Planctomicrobium sp. SH668 TaxID=3448126 RepID=UPI003F5B3190